MSWWQFALLGAGGGLLVEILALFHRCTAWQAARLTRTGRVRANLPTLRTYVDFPAHAWIAAFRSGLGAAMATIFGTSGQISGAYAAAVLGFSAPSLLAQLGSIPQVSAAVPGLPSAPSGKPPDAPVAPVTGEATPMIQPGEEAVS